MFCRSAAPVFIAILVLVTTARAQTDTGPPPKAAQHSEGPSAAPWSMPDAVCSDERLQKQNLPPSQQMPKILSPLAHLDQVTAIAHIPDLNYVVTGSNDGTIRIWDSETSDQVELLFSDYTRRVSDVAGRPKHKTQIAASISASGLSRSYVALFDLTTGRARTLCSGGVVTALTFSSDGGTLAVLDLWSVSLWNIDTFTLIRRINGPRKAVQFLDSNTLAVHTEDSVVLTDAKSGEAKGTPIPTGVGTAFSVDLSHGILFHLNKNVLTIWSMSPVKLINTVQLFSDVQLLAFDQDQGRLYASGFESVGFGGGTRYIYRISGAVWNNVEAFGGPDDRVTALAVARGNLMVGEFHGQVRRFNVRENFAVEADLGIRAEDITSIATSAGDRYIAAGDRSGIISVWETDSGGYRELDHFNVRKNLEPFFPSRSMGVGVREQFIAGEPNPPPFLRVLNMAFLGDSTLLAVAYGSGHTLVIDVLSGKTAVDASISDMGLTNFVSIGSTELFIASAAMIHWWNIESGKSGDFATTLHGLSSLTLTPDNKTLIVAGQDGLQAFDAGTFTAIGSLVQRGFSTAIAVADGNDSVSVLSGTQLVTWHFKTGSSTTANLDRGIPTTLGPDFREEFGFQISASHRRVALVGYGIHIWDSKAPKVLRRMEVGFSVTAVAMTANGKTIVAGGRDGTIGFIDLASGTELGSLFSLSPLGWYGHTRSGFFDASPLLWDRLSFAPNGAGLATLSSSDMFGRYFTPNAIPRILVQRASPPVPSGAASTSSGATVAARAVVPPLIEITSPHPTVKIGHGVLQELSATRTGPGRPPTTMKFLRPQPQGSMVESGPRLIDPQVTVALRATDRGGGLSSCKLFRNSHLIHSFMSLPEGQRSVSLSWDAQMLPGSVEFSAYCFDKHGNRSAVARSTVVGDDKLRGTRRAFILGIGIGRYQRPGLHLNFAESDVDLVTDTLHSALSNTRSFDDVIPIKLRDEEATDTNILAALHLLAGTFQGNRSLLPKQIRDLPVTSAQDTVFFYFTGHGTKSESRYFLLANNFHLDLATGRVSGAVSDLALANALEALGASQVVVILDACESGAALDAEQRSVGPFNFKSFAQMAYDKGIFVISATQSDSDAHESADLCHAQFTYVLVEDGLVSNLADWRPVDKVITTKEWLQYGAEKVEPVTPHKHCQLVESTQAAAAGAKRPKVTRNLWEQTPRLFLPDVYSGFDFTVSDFRAATTAISKGALTNLGGDATLHAYSFAGILGETRLDVSGLKVSYNSERGRNDTERSLSITAP
jgi:WD40 repeat protein